MSDKKIVSFFSDILIFWDVHVAQLSSVKSNLWVHFISQVGSTTPE